MVIRCVRHSLMLAWSRLHRHHLRDNSRNSHYLLRFSCLLAPAAHSL
ncbi:unnamed protein product [Strongylus vulgaris]|uniref:Uncharacterized protein n=1 Tax=Strongylus vulgaris TaxID=40348 RepID=A0A3P7LD57_STRVU|nr:unnamed protein product [Strongylus vulgaris]